MATMQWISFCNNNTWQITSCSIVDGLLKMIRNHWNQFECNIFPGPQPISIERSHFQTLKENSYWVCAKTDGVRYILACLYYGGQNYMFLINRKKEVFLLNFEIDIEAFKGTILDGELVRNNATNAYEYHMYDVTTIYGKDVTNLKHHERIQHIMQFSSNIRSTNVKPPFDIKIKTFFPLNQMKKYVDDIVPTLTHDIDGYIFTPDDDPVKSGTHDRMFKWKERMKNTVDFIVDKKNKSEDEYVLKISKGKYATCLHDQKVILSDSLKSQISTKTIIECQYVSQNVWKALWVRKDKNHPNNYLTYTKTLLNIRENIQVQEFMSMDT